MAERPISPEQLKRLHTLWSLLCRHAHIDPRDRGARLGWFTGAVGRPVQSSKELTRAEAIGLINEVQKHLPQDLIRKTTRPDRRTAKAYGTEGRKSKSENRNSKTITLIDAPTWKLLNDLVAKRGWTRAQLDAFVRSPHGPGRLVTLADANRVIWAVKQMMSRKSKSENRKSEILEEVAAK